MYTGARTPTKVTGSSGYHAYSIGHYQNYPKPATTIWGLGEYETGSKGFEPYCWKGTDMRYYDIAYFAGWCFCNYWPNFLEGMNRELYAYKATTYSDRVDGTGVNATGWGSPVVTWMQQNFHPYLVLDWGLHNQNKYDSDGETFLGKLWPENTSSYSSGNTVTRELVIFNDGYLAYQNDTNTFRLTWEARWDSPTGQVAESGEMDNIRIKTGFHVEKELSFTAPSENDHAEPIEAELEDTEVFTEERIFFNVSNKKLYMVIRLYLKDDVVNVADKTPIKKNHLVQKPYSFKIVNSHFSLPPDMESINGYATVSIYNLQGRLIHHAIAKNPVAILKSNNSYAKGIYIVNVKCNSNK